MKFKTWIENDVRLTPGKCSHCGEPVKNIYGLCPHCHRFGRPNPRPKDVKRPDK